MYNWPFFRCPSLGHIQLRSVAKEDLYINGIGCSADQAILGRSWSSKGEGYLHSMLSLGLTTPVELQEWGRLRGSKCSLLRRMICWSFFDNCNVTEELQASLARFVCAVYCSKGIQIRMSCAGTLSASIWQRVTNYHLQLAPRSSTFSGHMVCVFVTAHNQRNSTITILQFNNSLF